MSGGERVSKRRMGWVAAVALAASACAVRLGGPSPQEYQALAWYTDDGVGATEVAQQIQDATAELVLLAGPRDTAWFQEVADAAGLQVSGPGTTGPRGLAFLSGLEPLGDTSIVLAAGDGRLHMHDALYEIDGERLLDLMLVTVQEDADLREAVRTLLSYIATDVGATAAVLMGIEAPTAQASDSISVLMRAAFANAYDCAAEQSEGSELAPPGRIRMFYGPAVRMRCMSARTLPGAGSPITARLVVGR